MASYHSNSVLRLITQIFAKKFKSLYFNAREAIGDHKRTLVVYQVEQACVSLEETRDEFADALKRFNNLLAVNDAPLEHRYNLLNRQYQFCRAKSDTVSQRIKAIEEVSEALFSEWERELNEYSSRSLKSASKQQLKTARQQYARLIKAMHKAESKIHPVLAAFKDQVLYLKHNLNARAIAALQNEWVDISMDITQLILAMECIIAEANQFVAVLANQKALEKQ
jgi:hypothetical protein